MNLQELVAAVLADGTVDAQEVVQLQEAVYADGVVDKEEADALFEINDAVSGKENAPEWTGLFATAIADYVLADEESPNVIDADEAAYILEKIQGDGQVDAQELALLKQIKDRASIIDPTLGAFITEQGL